MRNFTIGSVTDIPIRLNITLVVFLPLLAWLISRPEQLAAYATAIDLVSPHAVDAEAVGAGRTPLLLGAAAAIGLFVSVLVHELGHSWTARRFDVGISSITLWIFGGMAHMEDLPEDWNVEFWIAIAGPITSLLLAGGFFGALQVVPASAPVVLYVVGLLAVVNLSLAIFNMLPAFPMDGGRVLRALLVRSRTYASATQIAATVGQGFAVLMAIFAVLSGALLLLLIAMFVYVAAAAESRTTVVRDMLRGITVSDLLADRGDAVEADTTVQSLLERIVAERRNGYPVVEGTELVGLITLAELRDVPPSERDSRRVSEAMKTDPPTISPDADAFEALRLISKERTDRIVVAENGRVYGTISQRDLMSALEAMQGLGDVSQTEIDADGYA
jgi:Zn-dependent protease/CBS domain-containing protein